MFNQFEGVWQYQVNSLYWSLFHFLCFKFLIAFLAFCNDRLDQLQ